jgi:DUF971 family protein
MLENNLRQKKSTQEGIVVSDPEGVVIAWRDGVARRFSWDQLRQLSMNKEISGQSAKQESALAQRAA